jgi:hypothetical protein
MSFRRWIDGWRFILLMVLAVTLLRWWIDSTLDDFEVSLNINEPWEDMLQRSNAAIGPIPSGKVWSNKSRSGVCLRFNDPDYGFVTPLARYFTITSKNGRVGRVRLSPQIEPLPLDDALKVVLGLHDQWREKGWIAAKVLDDPVIADTPEWRAWLRDGTGYASPLLNPGYLSKTPSMHGFKTIRSLPYFHPNLTEPHHANSRLHDPQG